MPGKIFLAAPRGFCAGVRRALETVEMMLQSSSEQVYVFHEIVHNNFIVENLKSRGVIFVESLEEVPDGATLIFSAHGVSKPLEEAAAAKQLKLLDATCPLVKKIHHKAETLFRKNRLIILIGHRGHPETVGTLGQIGNQALVVESITDISALPELKAGQSAAYLTQTTLSPDDTAPIVRLLREKYPDIEGDGDICYATQNRQNAIKQLSSRCDLVLVIGSPKSSNSNRLKEVAELSGASALLIDSPVDIPPDILNGINNIGITAGASAPECLVAETVASLKQLGWCEVEEIVCVTENVYFSLPPHLS